MTHRALVPLTSLAILVAASSSALAHCQMPCGIYNDPLRFALLEEHVTAIEKAMTEIQRLSKESPPNWNQIVRWVNDKDEEADELTHIVTFYFMAQRVKPADPKDKAAYAKYVYQLTLLHQTMISAMKAKQTTDLENCVKLRELLAKFKASYLPEQATPAKAGQPASNRR
jgi:nickel superoxide dismutase